MREDSLQSGLGRGFPGSASHTTPPAGHPQETRVSGSEGTGQKQRPDLILAWLRLTHVLAGSDL